MSLRDRVQTWLIKLLSWSQIYHVAVGYDEAVINPTMNGVLYYGTDWYEENEKHLVAIFDVPITCRIDPSYFEYWVGKPIKPWPPILRWLRRGRGPLTYDCLSIALACLDAGGVDVPFTITTPAALRRWLISEGYTCQTPSDLKPYPPIPDPS